jgi:hypothetical protein
MLDVCGGPHMLGSVVSPEENARMATSEHGALCSTWKSWWVAHVPNNYMLDCGDAGTLDGR